MTATPRATPVVQAPRQNPPISERVPRKFVSAPVVVVTTAGEWELEHGELIVGRDFGANIVLRDPLVSRLHARIAVGSDGLVSIEDLQSANGVFVNGNKLAQPSALLSEGDRLLIGTTEVSVFSLRGSARLGLGQQGLRSPYSHAAPDFTRSSNEDANAEQRPISRRPLVTTGRSDATNLVGQFAEQLMDSGHPLEAVRVLSEHLQNLVKGATAGLNVPGRILEVATHYALTLLSWTQKSLWLDYVFELHLASLQVPSDESLNEIESILRTAWQVDAAQVSYFIKTIERRHIPLSANEANRLRRIEGLCAERASKPPSSG
jgi:hypothetical protein